MDNAIKKRALSQSERIPKTPAFHLKKNQIGEKEEDKKHTAEERLKEIKKQRTNQEKVGEVRESMKTATTNCEPKKKHDCIDKK